MATIRDVAKECGVSVATVSFVLNDGPRPVSAETRRRVQEAVHRLNFHPNASARNLARRRTNTIGVLFAQITTPVITINVQSSSILQGVMNAAATTGYNVTLFTQAWRDHERSSAHYRDRMTDGILLVAPPVGSDVVPALADLRIPLVVMWSPSGREDVPFVDVDNARGAELAAEHLLSLGHRRIAHIAGDESQTSAEERRDSFVRALLTAGIVPPADYILPGAYYAQAGYEQALRLLRTVPRPTAIFAANDAIAAGVLRAARDQGVRVPQELSVVGFDDNPAVSLISPPLTTIRQPHLEIGETATRLLVARVSGREPTVTAPRTLLAPELIVRETTAPPSQVS